MDIVIQNINVGMPKNEMKFFHSDWHLQEYKITILSRSCNQALDGRKQEL